MKSLTPAIIIDYWYLPRIKEQWFNSTPELDDEIRNQFESVWLAAANHQLDDWLNTGEGCLALCIILDQFPLNMFRGEAKGFFTEQQAVEVSKHAVATGQDQSLDNDKKVFLYMPLMHSENLADQAESVRLFDAAGLEHNAKFARHHQDIIKRFGRFPHRNAILGRESTEAELEYLNSKEAFTG